MECIRNAYADQKGRELPALEDGYVAGNPRWSGSERMVVVSGCSGGGKSALIAVMAARGYPVFPEPGRQAVKEEALVGGGALPWTDPAAFAARCIARAAYFFNIADPSVRPVLFDRGIIDAVTALERLGAVPAPCAEAARRYRYGRRVFMAPPWPELFAADSERRHGFEAAVEEYEALIRSYPAHGYEVVVLPRTSIRERADFVEAALAEAVR
jgi:predicted ATPase